MPDRQEQMRRLITELQMMQGTADTMQSRLQLLQSAITDLSIALTSLGALKEADEGAPILVPTGGGTYVNANLGDLGKIIINIGADVSIDMTLEEAEENLQARLEEVEKAGTSVQQQLQQVLSQMQVHQDVINRISANLRGEATGV